MMFRQERPLTHQFSSEARRWLVRLKKRKVIQSQFIHIASCGGLTSEVILVQVNEVSFLSLEFQQL